MALPEELRQRCEVYAERHEISISDESPLGFGQDGMVWKSSRATAIKAVERERNYENERHAYELLRENGIVRIGCFDVPRLVHADDELQIVEMGIVSCPYLLDFGKAYVNRPSPYTAEQIADSMEGSQQLFSPDDWRHVEDAVLELKLLGIIYLDIKPANIRLR